jgi:hypothetical protein
VHNLLGEVAIEKKMFSVFKILVALGTYEGSHKTSFEKVLTC